MRICVVEVEAGRLGDWLAIRNQLEPDEPLLLEQLLARRAAEPERRELFATTAGETVGVGAFGAKGSPPDLAYGTIAVRAAWRERAVESALLVALCELARKLARSRLEVWAREDDSGLIACLEKHRFREVMREGGLALAIAAMPTLETPHVPTGITIRPVASRPELGDGAYEVAAQTWSDIPGESGIEKREAWLRLNVEGAAGGAVVALHAERVVGFAGLQPLAGEGLYEHGLLAVLPHYRRRGIARAMKTAQLQWLKDHGARRVVTWNSEANHAARTLNLALGYTALPASIAFHGRV